MEFARRKSYIIDIVHYHDSSKNSIKQIIFRIKIDVLISILYNFGNLLC